MTSLLLTLKIALQCTRCHKMTVITMAAKCSKHVVIYNTYNPLHNCSKTKKQSYKF